MKKIIILGFLFCNFLFANENIKNEIAKLELQCLKNANSCYQLGLKYLIIQDLKKAKEVFKQACDTKRNGLSCDAYALILNGENNKREAFNYYERACEYNIASSCTMLAIMYFTGQNVRIDNKKAIDLFQKSCDNNFAFACFQLSQIYYDGKIVLQNEILSKRLLKKAIEISANNCKMGNKEACNENNAYKRFLN